MDRACFQSLSNEAANSLWATNTKRLTAINVTFQEQTCGHQPFGTRATRSQPKNKFPPMGSCVSSATPPPPPTPLLLFESEPFDDTHPSDPSAADEFENSIADPTHTLTPSPLDPLARYALDLPLGVGAFGVTFSVRRRADGRPFAAKICHLPPGDAPPAAMSEAALLGRLKGLKSRIVELEEAFLRPNGDLVLVLEPCAADVARVAARLHAAALRPAEAFVWAVARDVALALAALHEQSIVHCDVKPSNSARFEGGGSNFEVFVAADGRAKLGDFGSAVEARDGAVRGGGTPYYCPPEWDQETPPPPAHSADIWALGVTLLRLAVPRETLRAHRLGAAPSALGGEALKKLLDLVVNEGYTLALKKLVKRLSCLNPAERPTAAEVVALVDSLRPLELTEKPQFVIPTAANAPPPVAKSSDLAVYFYRADNLHVVRTSHGLGGGSLRRHFLRFEGFASEGEPPPMVTAADLRPFARKFGEAKGGRAIGGRGEEFEVVGWVRTGAECALVVRRGGRR
jgi:hypothetical protein